jgi:hypothetical protein
MEANIFIVPEELIYIYFRLSPVSRWFLYLASLPADLLDLYLKQRKSSERCQQKRETPLKLCKFNLKSKLIFHDFQFYRLVKLKEKRPEIEPFRS